MGSHCKPMPQDGPIRHGETVVRGLLGVALLTAAAPAVAEPVPPCASTGSALVPPYAALDEAPTVAFWHDLELARIAPCLGARPGHSKLVVALAGRFKSAGSIEGMAGRIGAISASKGLRYWSATEGRWRTLISDAFALRSPDGDGRRADFTAREVLSGRSLFFAQRDTRSTSLNVYSLTGRATGDGRMTVKVVNLTTIRIIIFPMFEPEALRSFHFFEELAPGVLGYYGLSVVASGSVEGYESSLVNRAAAAYRFFKGVAADRDPPLAP